MRYGIYVTETRAASGPIPVRALRYGRKLLKRTLYDLESYEGWYKRCPEIGPIVFKVRLWEG